MTPLRRRHIPRASPQRLTERHTIGSHAGRHNRGRAEPEPDRCSYLIRRGASGSTSCAAIRAIYGVSFHRYWTTREAPVQSIAEGACRLDTRHA